MRPEEAPIRSQMTREIHLLEQRTGESEAVDHEWACGCLARRRAWPFQLDHDYDCLIRISSTTARGGRLMASSAHAATSSARNIFARAASFGGTGRLSSNGVSMSPGKIAQARIPFPRSSALMDCVRPARPNF